MPVDTDLTPQIAQPGQGNPLGTIQSFATIQNALNQNKLFQQQFQARQLAGQIISSAPDLETGLGNLYKDPRTAAFAGDIANSVRNAQTSLIGQQKAQQELNQTGLQGFYGMLGPMLADPSKFEETWQRGIATMAPMARSDLAPQLKSMHDTLGKMAKSDPDGFRQQIIALLPQAAPVDRIIGTATTRTGPGGEPVSGVQAPAQSGGGFTPATPLTTPTPSNESGGNALAADGRPLLVPKASPPQAAGRSDLGAPVLTPGQNTANQELQKQFAGPDRQDFESANQSLASLKYINNAMDNVVKGGGFLTPGTMMPARLAIAKAANTISQMTGGEPYFDPSKVASAEDWYKETTRMGAQVAKQLIRGQEAASTINTITTSVPNMENSYLGGKLVAGGVQAALQRLVDERNFKIDWQQRNGGNMLGADEAFNSAHPAQGYADKVLEQYGLDEHGFQSPDTVLKYLKQGFLTKGQAKNILESQFPEGRAKEGE